MTQNACDMSFSKWGNHWQTPSVLCFKRMQVKPRGWGGGRAHTVFHRAPLWLPFTPQHEPTARAWRTSRESYRCEIRQGESHDESGPKPIQEVPDKSFIRASFLLGFHKNKRILANTDLWDPFWHSVQTLNRDNRCWTCSCVYQEQEDSGGFWGRPETILQQPLFFFLSYG